jgi:hypothetical protein
LCAGPPNLGKLIFASVGLAPHTIHAHAFFKAPLKAVGGDLARACLKGATWDADAARGRRWRFSRSVPAHCDRDR